MSYSISGNTASISCAKDANIGMDAQTIVFKVTGTLDDGSTYIDYVTVKIVPNVTGTDGRGYEYVYYLSDQSESNFITQPYRLHGVLQPMGWQDDPMEPTREKQYVYVAYKTGDVGADGNFSEPKALQPLPEEHFKYRNLVLCCW